MSGVVYLLAGNPHARGGKPDPAMQAFIKEVGKKKPRVAYLGTASGDDNEFFEHMRTRLLACGAGDVELMPLCGAAADPAEARCLLARADAVFVSGGDVEEGMAVLHAQKGLIACERLGGMVISLIAVQMFTTGVMGVFEKGTHPCVPGSQETQTLEER